MASIGDYALIGDCHSTALVDKGGSVDWACFPHFDSPSVFGRILDEKRGGHFTVQPDSAFSVDRAYLEDTNVLVTNFRTASGVLELTDCMPLGRLDPERPTRAAGYSSILRRARVLEGSVRVHAVVQARFEYGSFIPRFRMTSERTCEIVGGADALWLTCTRPLVADYEHVEGTWDLQAGEEVWLETAWTVSFKEKRAEEHPDEEELRRRLADTIRFWREWIAQCSYEGDHLSVVRRSALALKALTFAPTGAVVAAPTTSLPEEIGGVRNWDYRYTWIRDTTLTLISLLTLGFREEADAYRQWFRRTSAGRPQDLQIMYSIHGSRSLPEIELSHLAGHKNSAPVRIGNGAVKQLQLDSYGQIIEAAYLYTKLGGEITATNWRFLRGLADLICQKWRNPDQGIWEIRDEPRHFVHSKLLCWVGLDRALHMVKQSGLEGDTQLWESERSAIRAYLMKDATERGYFSQAVGREETDASVLLLPALGFIAAADPLMKATLQRLRSELEKDGFVWRYHATDGLAGGEGAFLLCSLWLIDALVHAGELADAERIMQKILGLANDVGLYAEEALPQTGEALGNFPQAFTHMALVTTCAHLTAARRGDLPVGKPIDFAEFAMSRLLADRSNA